MFRRKGQKVWMRRSESQTFDDICFIKDWDYDEVRFGWNYKLRNEAEVELEGWHMETNLKKA